MIVTHKIEDGYYMAQDVSIPHIRGFGTSRHKATKDLKSQIDIDDIEYGIYLNNTHTEDSLDTEVDSVFN